MNDSEQRQARKNRISSIALTGVLLISACFCNQVSAMPGLSFGKKDAEKEDDPNTINAIPKVKLTKEQQTEFDTSLKNGNTYLQANNLELALICFMRCTTLNPGSVEGHLGLAYCNVGLRKGDAAQSEIFDALRCDPNHIQARFLLGEIMMTDKRFDEAGGQYLQILKQQPDNLSARGNLATCLHLMGQTDAAIGQYKYILDKDPKSAQAAFNLGAAYELKGNADEAAKNYKKVIELDPKNTNAYCSLAKCLMAKKDFKSAQVLLSHALKDTPNSYYVHLMQGSLDELQGDKRGAIEEYTKARALNPNDPDSQKFLQRMIEAGVDSMRNNKRIGGNLKITR